MKNILIIDDDEIICRLFEKLSRQKDALVTIAKTGKDARDVLQSGKRFDFVLLDLVIPDISGWDILTVIRNNPAMKDTPVVILTGLALSTDETEKLGAKVSAIISKKKFEISEFEQLMNKLMKT